MADEQPRGRNRRRNRAAVPAAAAVAVPAAVVVPAAEAVPAAVAAPVVAPPAANVAAIPPVPQQQAVADPPRGRGRGRNRATTAQAAAAIAPVAGPSGLASDASASQLGQMSVGPSHGSGVPVGRGTIQPNQGSRVVAGTSSSGMSGAQTTNVELTANYFQLLKREHWTLCKHHVEVVPDEERTFVKKRLLGQHMKDFKYGYVFDGSTIFTLVNMCPDGKPKEYVCRYTQGRNEDGSEICKEYSLTVKFVGTVEPGDFQNLQVFNVILRECLAKLNLKLIRRNYYDNSDDAKVRIPEFKLELLPGYTTSFLQLQTEVMLLAEIKYSVNRRDTVYERLCELSRDSRRTVRDDFPNEVVGCVVSTTYNQKYYKITDVDFDATPRSTFEQKKKGQTTHVHYSDYVNERYGKTCQDLNQPMLISRSNKREIRAGQAELVYLIPEFCCYTGLREDMRRNFSLMKQVNGTVCVGPSNRIRRLKDFNRRLTGVEEVSRELTSWGLQLAPDLVRFTGKLLPSQNIVVGGLHKTIEAGEKASWDLKNHQMLQSIGLTNWLLTFPRRSSQEVVTWYRSCLCPVYNGMKCNIVAPHQYPVDSDTDGSYVETIRRALNERNPQMVVCIVPNISPSRYRAIKRLLILDKPTPSQVILLKNVTDSKKAMSVATKLAVQMNCKLGGVPWAIHIPAKGIMVVGYDVCHDPKDKCRSFGAMVSTRDDGFVRWYSNVTHHSAGEEISINFALNVQKCLVKRMETGGLPSTIVIFRDGVGEGQVEKVKGIELDEVKKVLEPIYEAQGKTLKLAFVIVTKRINTRIFRGESNPLPGTVADSCITRPPPASLTADELQKIGNFFLVSQLAQFGTVSPTHYNVIENTTAINLSRMQTLTYILTHLYYNWSGTVGVPAPCQYAHKLAFLTANSVMATHSNLDKLLYYL